MPWIVHAMQRPARARGATKHPDSTRPSLNSMLARLRQTLNSQPTPLEDDYQAMPEDTPAPVEFPSTFDCCSDRQICCAVAFCMPTTTAQLTTMLIPSRFAYLLVSALLWVFGVLWVLPDSAGIMMPEPLANALTLLWLLVMITMCAVTAAVKMKLRKDDAIAASGCFASCSKVEDCCCSLWCTHCTQCMLLRHEVAKGKYSLCSADGLPWSDGGSVIPSGF